MYWYIGVLTVVGIIAPIILQKELVKLLRAGEHPTRCNHPLVKCMVQKFTACYKLHQNVNNVDSFVDKYVYTYKFGGLYLSTWDKICGQPAFLLLIGCITKLVIDYLSLGGQPMKLSTAVFGVLIAGLLIIYNTLFDRIGIIKAFSQEMKDYFENTLQTRLERDYIYPELAKTQASGLVAASEFAAHTEETATGPDGVTASAVDIERRHAAAREPRVAGRPKERKHPALCLEEEIIDEILAEYLS